MVDRLADLLQDEGGAYDIKGHGDVPPGLRLWAGGTMEGGDLEASFPWLDWGWSTVRDEWHSDGG